MGKNIAHTGNDAAHKQIVRPIEVETDPSTMVTAVVTAINDQRIDELPPLYDAVDPDALATILESAPEATVGVQFTYAGCRVRITPEQIRAVDTGAQ